MQCQEFIALLEQYAPTSAAAGWDNSGIQIVGEKMDVERVLVALDPSVYTIDAALDFGADFILCHHPLSLQPQFLANNNSYTTLVRKIMRSGAHLYSAHTSLDANPCGPARWLAAELALEMVQTLEPNAPCNTPRAGQADSSNDVDGAEPYGFGFVGRLPKPLALYDFFGRLKTLLPASTWNICGKQPEFVQTVACCPGSGGSLWPAAKAKRADILVTGDIKYHVALDTELCILDVGHFSLEEEMMRRLALELAIKVQGVEVKFLEAKDPISHCII